MPQMTQDKPQAGLRKWAPLIAASLALFIVVVDSTMIKINPARRVSAAETAWAS